MKQQSAQVEQDRRMILEAQAKGLRAKLAVYTRLSGPGWLQSAITLGSGSLAGSLYLGVLAGFSLLWLQLVAMVMGVIMLSAIAYVTLSTGRRPFQAINQHVNPVLGWGWAIATLMANMVWCLPQFSIGTAAVRQNLLPGLVGPPAMSDLTGKLIVCAAFLVLATMVIWFYDTGGWGIRLFEGLLKLMVAVIVVCFFGVVLKMSFSSAGLQWGRIFAGFVPSLRLFSSPPATYEPFIQALPPASQSFWVSQIVSQQRDVMVTAAATAVGINMTFLLPYSMLARGWDRHFRGLAVFDLSTGLIVPFVLATSCVVIASAVQFHTRYDPGLVGEPASAGGTVPEPPPNLVGQYNRLLEARLAHELGRDAFSRLSAEQKAQRAADLPPAEKRMAARLVKRDAFNLAHSLSPLTGRVFSHYVFGIGVVGMALSTIIVLMLISGFVVCEMCGLPPQGTPRRLGSLLAGVGALGPFIWTGGRAQFWLAVPTSVFGMTLLPIAYFTFLLMMNNRRLMGEHMPSGGKRLLWNLLMLVALSLAAFGAGWSIWSKAHMIGVAIVAAFLLLAVAVHLRRGAQRATAAD